MSQQNAQTPREFLDAVEKTFGVKFVLDLACTSLDCVAPVGLYFDNGINSLDQDWSNLPTWVKQFMPKIDNAAYWLNPPWKQTGRFARKCLEGTDRIVEVPGDPDLGLETVHTFVQGPPIFSLFPAGVGSDWFGNVVLGNCAVYCLNPRITYLDPTTGLPFVSKKNGKPQTGLNDAILCHWGTDVEPGVFWWQWKEPAKRTRRKKLTTETVNGTE